MDFIYQPGLEQRGVDFPAAFAEQPFHVPLLAQPAQRKVKIQLFRSPQIFTSSASFRICVSFARGARAVVRMMMGEKRCLKISACGSSVPNR